MQPVCPAIQSAILENAAAHVLPGGRLIYSTCTLNPAENNRVAERFLVSHPEFEPEPILLEHTLDEPAYMLTMLPGVLDTDGFFCRPPSAAVWRTRDDRFKMYGFTGN